MFATLNSLNEKILHSMHKKGVRLRINVSPGTWTSVLLPVAIIISAINHPNEISKAYKLSTVLSIELLFNTILIIFNCCQHKSKSTPKIIQLISGMLTAAVLYYNLKLALPLSLVGGFLGSIFYEKCLFIALKHLPNTFSFGEANIVSQGFTLFIFSTLVNIWKCLFHVPLKTMDIATIIIQIGILAMILLFLLVYTVPFFQKPIPFYLATVIDVAFLILLPLQFILKRDPFMWLMGLLVRDINTLKLISFWIICVCICILAIMRQMKLQQNATSGIRKTFHLLAVAIFLPGYIYQCTLLYTSSGVIFGIIIFIEALRILNMPPLGPSLQEAFILYGDNKDSGGVALTALYLLIGSSLALWIHPSPCDIVDSAGFNLITLCSGLMTVGIGDTVASIIGSNIGTHHWPGSKKTFEGSLSSIVSQAIFVFCLIYFGVVYIRPHQLIKIFGSILFTTTVEAMTTQVDNLILPLIIFILLV